MNIVIPPLVIEENEGFEKDILNRENFGKALLNLVSQSSSELVISLDGQWGEGKTTFVKMWQGLLSNNEIPNVYINAFANDHVDDAFISVASAITAYVDNNTVKANEEKISEFKEKAISVGVQLLSWTAKVGIKAATLGAIKDSEIEELKEIKSDLSKGLSSVAGDFVKERLTSHAQDVKLLESFKTVLSEIPSLLSTKGNKPLIIIIDELDRCKPTYAVELIEKVKHLFSVKNVVFVLVMHRRQLEEAVKCVYGQNIDAHTYLQKFINIEAVLPKRLGDKYYNDLNAYSKKLFDLHQIEQCENPDNLIECISALANHFSLSLRHLERAYTNLAVYYASTTIKDLNLNAIISFLVVVKVINPSIYNAISLGKITYQEIYEQTGVSDEEQEGNNNHMIQRIAKWVKFSLMTDDEFKGLDENDRLNHYGDGLGKYNIPRKDLFPIHTRKINMFNAV